MFICTNCNKILESPVSIHEYHDELDDSRIEEYYGCPYCKSDQIVEAKQCSLCGEYVIDDYVVLKDGTVACQNCYVMY